MDINPINLAGPSFRSVEVAWFWAIRAIQAAPSRERPGQQVMHDVIKCLDALYRNRRIEMLHVRIMRIWGLRGVAPNPSRARERSDWRIWQEAMGRLDLALRARGIVGETLQDVAD